MHVVDSLAADWRRSGLAARDTVMIHSDIRRTIKRYARDGRHVRPPELFDSFLEVVGETGTILFPTFNYGYTSGDGFDIGSTPSKMGLLTEYARTQPTALRTRHPIYSFSVVGKEAPRFAALENISGWGPDSPFALLRELNGKVALLDCRNATMIHHAEEMAAIDYRLHTFFDGNYTEHDGSMSQKRYSFFARNLSMGVHNHLDPVKDAMMAEDGLFLGDQPGTGTGLSVANAQALFDFLIQILHDGRGLGMFYRLGEPEVARKRLVVEEVDTSSARA